MKLVEHCYSCACAGHENYILNVSAQADASKASGVLLDVMLLHVFEKLTQSLEDILQQPLNWRRYASCDSPSVYETLEMKLEFDSQTLIERASLYIPVSALSLISEHQIAQPEGVTDMSWQRVPCTLCLSELVLSEKEQENLHNGALLLIPESYQSAWNSSLRIGKSMQLPGRYYWTEDSWRSEKAAARDELQSGKKPARAQADTMGETSVIEQKSTHRVEFSCQLDPADLMRARENPVIIGLSTGQPGSVLHLRGAECAEFHGSLMPVGAGQAMLLKQGDTLAANP